MVNIWTRIDSKKKFYYLSEPNWARNKGPKPEPGKKNRPDPALLIGLMNARLVVVTSYVLFLPIINSLRMLEQLVSRLIFLPTTFFVHKYLQSDSLA